MGILLTGIFLQIPSRTLIGSVRPGRLSKADRQALLPGLTLTWETVVDSKQLTDVCRSRLAAFCVPAATPPSPFLPVGPFQATLSGFVKVKLKGSRIFDVQGHGKVILKINGRGVLSGEISQVDPVQVSLWKGYNRIDIEYHSPGSGDAQLRLNWSNKKLFFEPLPPEVLFTDGRDKRLKTSHLLRTGRWYSAGVEERVRPVHLSHRPGQGTAGTFVRECQSTPQRS